MIKDVFYTIQGEGANAGRAAVFVRFAGCNLWSGRPEDRERGRAACAEWCDTAFVGGDRMSREALEGRMFREKNLHGCTENTSAYGGGYVTYCGTHGLACEFHPHTAIFRKAAAAAKQWRGGQGNLCVLTGGEPALQIDQALIEYLHACGWEIAVETNGSVANEALGLVDHLCVSPKRGAALSVRAAHELKVVIPGASTKWAEGWTEKELLKLANAGKWGTKYVQPQDVLLSSRVEHSVLSLGGEQKGCWQDQQGEHDEYVDRCIAWVKRHPSWRLSLQTHKHIGVR